MSAPDVSRVALLAFNVSNATLLTFRRQPANPLTRSH
jgi:hypothetical protein